MLDALLRRISIRRQDKENELVLAYEHHIANLRDEIEWLRGQLASSRVEPDEPERRESPEPVPQRRSWTELRRSIEEKDRAYARDRSTVLSRAAGAESDGPEAESA